MTTTVLVAGATGDMGQRLVRELLAHDARVRVLTRTGSDAARRLFAENARVEVVAADYSDLDALTSAARGADVVVSAVSGTRPVIVDAQRALLAATVEAGVPRFIPSDYSADYRQIDRGSNRNFELRREFATDVDAAPLRATSVLIGAFTDLLTGMAPVVLFKQRRVLYWSDPDQVLNFTSKDDAARFTADVALDANPPRVVEVAGDSVTARDIAQTMTELTGTTYRLQWAGSTRMLSAMAQIGRTASRDATSAFPAWQGMQYFVSMFSGHAQLRHIDNNRYGNRSWTTVEDVLRRHLASGPHA